MAPDTILNGAQFYVSAAVLVGTLVGFLVVLVRQERPPVPWMLVGMGLALSALRGLATVRDPRLELLNNVGFVLLTGGFGFAMWQHRRPH